MSNSASAANSAVVIVAARRTPIGTFSGSFANLSAAELGTQLLTLKYGRDDETEADLVGLEIAARGGFKPEASVQLWKKMLSATGGRGG